MSNSQLFQKSKEYTNLWKKRKVAKWRLSNSKYVSHEHAAQLIAWIEEDCTLTLKELQSKIKTNFDLEISTTTITRVRSGFQFSLKRCPCIRKEEIVSQQLPREECILRHLWILLLIVRRPSY